MNFIAIIMTPSILISQEIRESVCKSYCPVSIQMHLIFIYVILVNRTGMINVSNAPMGTHINETIAHFTSCLICHFVVLIVKLKFCSCQAPQKSSPKKYIYFRSLETNRRHEIQT